MDAQAKAVQKANAVYEKAAMTAAKAAAKAYDRAWNAKAKAYAKAKALMPKQPPPFPVAAPPHAAADLGFEEVDPPADGPAAVPIAVPKAFNYPYLAKAAAFVHPQGQDRPGQNDPDVEGRQLKSRRIAAGGAAASRAFAKAMRTISSPDPRMHYYPEQTGFEVANELLGICDIVEGRLARE
eukprot:GEMP01025027.1.p1 GENE.GEMP01025027.1~~GEMP01025027.1.p1  ORF type:complete len:182 (-),score=32.38 GEMP01025027.1:779-1324(-)